ncbi:MFS general substrate transporter [Ramaria rubella]|nr:MFS general substrate transporter [Ramaria rubella]
MSGKHTETYDDKKCSSDEGLSPVLTIEEQQRTSYQEWNKVKKRIDMRIMPWLCLTYLVMRIDVNNVSNAAIINTEQGHGIKQDLHLSPQQWTWVVACFFYPYAAFEPLSTLVMHKFTPSRWIGRIMISWGGAFIPFAIAYCIMLNCCGSELRWFNYHSRSWSSALWNRVISSIIMKIDPCVIYYLAFFFRPEELALRVALFYSFGQISGFVSGFLAFAISFADGRIHAWRWLFIIEGLPAILMGIGTLFILPDFPETAKFLNEKERALVTSRLSEYAPKKNTHTWSTAEAWALLLDPTFYSFNLAWLFHAVGGFGLALVLPTVIFDLGFESSAMSNVLSMPPSLLTFILLNILGWIVQRGQGNPFLIAALLEMVNIICCILLLTVKVNIVKYLALMVASGTAGSVYPILWPARVKAARGTTSAGLAIGFTNACAQLSGILGPQLFLPSFGPDYRVSFIVCCGLLFGAIVCIAASWILMRGEFDPAPP